MNFFKNASYATLEKIVTSGLKFFIVFIIATTMGPAGQGEYSFLITFWSSCYFFFSFGLDMGTNYFASKRSEVLPQIFGNAVVSAAVLCTLPIMATLAGEHYSDYFAKLNDTFPILLAGLICNFFFVTLKSTLYGRSEFKLIFIGSLAQYGFVLIALAVGFFMDVLTIKLTMTIWLIGVLLCTLICLVRNLMLTRGKIGFSLGLLRELSAYGRNVYLFTVLNSLNLRLDTFLVVYFLTFDELGYYNLAVVFMEIILYLPTAFTRVILAEVSVRGKMDEDVFPNLSGLTLLTLIGVGLTTPVGILLFFPAFTKSIYLFLILLPSGYLMGMSYAMCYYLLGKNRSEIPARSSLVACILTLVGNVVLLPLIGVYGAAITTLLSYMTTFILLYRSVSQIEDIQLRPRFDWVRKMIDKTLQKLKRAQ